MENEPPPVKPADEARDDELPSAALHALNARLVEAQEQERRRIARELHDGINQKLAVLALEIGYFARNILSKDPEGAKRLFELRDQTAELSRDVRRVSHRLHPAVLEHMGLVGAIRNTCREYWEASGVLPFFTTPLNLGELDADVTLALFRITQESLQNIARHAKATAVEVTLMRTGSELVLQIEDNGVGMNALDRRSWGLGLVSMNERSRQVGGRFDVSSPSTGGVMVTVRIPMRLKQATGD